MTTRHTTTQHNTTQPMQLKLPLEAWRDPFPREQWPYIEAAFASQVYVRLWHSKSRWGAFIDYEQ